MRRLPVRLRSPEKKCSRIYPSSFVSLRRESSRLFSSRLTDEEDSEEGIGAVGESSEAGLSDGEGFRGGPSNDASDPRNLLGTELIFPSLTAGDRPGRRNMPFRRWRLSPSLQAIGHQLEVFPEGGLPKLELRLVDLSGIPKL